MESVTVLIASFIGPILLAVGLGILFSRNYYTKIYRDLEKETLAVFMGGITTLVAGIAIVMNHNVWEGLMASIVSFIGWASIVKGLILIISPKVADNFGNRIAETKLFPALAVITIALGGYLTYMVYMYNVLS